MMSKDDPKSLDASKIILDEKQLEQVSGGEKVLIDKLPFTPPQISNDTDEEHDAILKYIQKLPGHMG